MSEMTGMNVRGFDQDGKLITETFPEMKTRVLKEQSEDANKAYNLTDELKVAVFDMIWNKPKKERPQKVLFRMLNDLDKILTRLSDSLEEQVKHDNDFRAFNQ